MILCVRVAALTQMGDKTTFKVSTQKWTVTGRICFSFKADFGDKVPLSNLFCLSERPY